MDRCTIISKKVLVEELMKIYNGCKINRVYINSYSEKRKNAQNTSGEPRAHSLRKP